MAHEQRIGPGRVIIGTSITAPLESWTDVGGTRGDTVVTPRVSLAMGSLDQTAHTPLASAVFRRGEMVSATFPMLNRDLSTMALTFPNSVLATANGQTSLACGSGMAKVTPVAVAVVPVDESTSGLTWWNSNYCFWMQDAVVVATGEVPFNLPAEGDDALSSATTEVTVTSLANLARLAATRSAVIGRLHLHGIGPLGLDVLWEAGVDTGTTPLIGGASVFTRASTGTYVNPATGKLTSAAINAPRFEAKGLLVEPQRTGKTQRNVGYGTSGTGGWAKSGDAAATLTAVNDAAELAAAGLDLIVTDSTVLKLDNSAGTGSAWVVGSGATGTATRHTLTAYVRGTGSIRLHTSGDFALAQQQALTSAYRRLKDSMTASLTTGALNIYANPGTVVYFVLAQMEDGEFETSVIPNSTAGSVTRSADSWTIGLLNGIDPAGVSVQMAIAPLFAEGGNHLQVPVTLGTGLWNSGVAAPYVHVRHFNTTGWEIATDNGAGTAASGALVGDSLPAGALTEITFGIGPTGKKWYVSQNDADVSPAGTLAQSYPTAVWGGAQLLVGPFAGHVQRIASARGDRTAAELRQLKRS